MPSKRGRPPARELTPGQKCTLKKFEQLSRRNRKSPTVRELAEALRISGTSVHSHLRQLVEKGYLKSDDGKARGLTLVRRADEPVPDLVSVPLLGHVAGGVPLLADENVLGEVLVEGSVVGDSSCFALTVVGDSMKRAQIRDGDVVIVRQQQLAESGDIVVALVDQEATVKRLMIDEAQIQLLPENPKFKPIDIELETDFRILGKVIAVRRLS